MRYTVFDVETPNYANNRMSAIGIVIMEDDRIVERFYSLVDPQARFDPFNIALTGITPEMVADAPSFDVLWPRIKKYMDDAVLVAHNAQFDMAVLSKCLRDYGIYWRDTAAYICTCKRDAAVCRAWKTISSARCPTTTALSWITTRLTATRWPVPGFCRTCGTWEKKSSFSGSMTCWQGGP